MTISINKTTRSRYILACVAVLATAAIADDAFADQSPDPVSAVHVRYNDLDLSTAQGTSALYRRISTAARQVCGQVDTRDLSGLALVSRCQAEAISRAVNDVHSPQLAMVHASHMRRG